MKVRITEDANVLVPNKEHQNFIENGQVIEEGSIVEGNYKEITGKRRGAPFTYRLFITDKNQIIYKNKTNPMEDTTEVKLGADAQTTPTKVDMKPAEIFNQTKMAGLVIGGIAGFAYCKWKKHDMKKSAMYIALGAVAGYGIGYLIDNRRKVTVKPSN